MKIHFIGIGGVSMSSLALMLSSRGHTVTGSDNVDSAAVEKLRGAGVSVIIGHKTPTLTDVDLVVYTAAVSPDNRELLMAKESGIPIAERAELLGLLSREYDTTIAVSGSHGKTTASGMIASMLLQKKPTVHIGGTLPAIGGNCCIGGGEYFVTEACEYHRSFLSIHATIAVILNVEEDHLDYYSGIDDIKSAFRQFCSRVSPDGTVVVCGDSENAMDAVKNCGRRIVTFGRGQANDYSAQNVRESEPGKFVYELTVGGEPQATVELGVFGEHNVLNSLAAIAAVRACGVEFAEMLPELKVFTGMDRRWQHVGVLNGAPVYIDYAHHPTEIETTLKLARSYHPQRIITLFQPHTYTRTQKLFDRFVEVLSQSDVVLITPVYAAREAPIEGVSGERLASAVSRINHLTYFCHNLNCAAYSLNNLASNGDLVLILGAGDIVDVVSLLPQGKQSDQT